MLDELGHNPIPLPGWGIKTNLPGKLWPNPILNSNTWVPIPNNIFDWHIYVHVRWTQTQSNTQFQFQGGVSKSICWASYDPIQYPIPIQGYPYRTIFLTVICTCWMNSDPIQYPIPIPGWGIKTNLPDELWPNPIPNSNTRVPIQEKIFLMDILAGWIRTQSNTQFQFQGGVSKVIYRTSYDPIQYLIPIQGYPFKGKYFWRTYMMDELGHNLPGKHWPHPIPNSNTWVPIPNNIFDWHMYMLD